MTSLRTLKRLIGFGAYYRSFGWIRRNWSESTEHEIEFWRGFIRSGGGVRPSEIQDWAGRLDPRTELQTDIVRLLDAPDGAHLKIVDVGAGPATFLGKLYPGRTLEIFPVDPLADIYNRILDECGVTVPVRTESCDGENVAAHFGLEFADFVISRNAIDHAVDLVKIIGGMIRVCRTGGKVYVTVEENEGQNEGYVGLHQWNFAVNNGDLVIWRPGMKVLLGGHLRKLGDVDGCTSS